MRLKEVKEFIQIHTGIQTQFRLPSPCLYGIHLMHLLVPSVLFWPEPSATSSGSVASQPRNLLHLGPTRVLPGRVRTFPLLMLGSWQIDALRLWLLPPFWTLVKHWLWDLVLPPKGAREETKKLCPMGSYFPLERLNPKFPSPSSVPRIVPRHSFLNILLENFSCSWTDKSAKWQLLSSELFRKQC